MALELDTFEDATEPTAPPPATEDQACRADNTERKVRRAKRPKKYAKVTDEAPPLQMLEDGCLEQSQPEASLTQTQCMDAKCFLAPNRPAACLTLFGFLAGTLFSVFIFTSIFRPIATPPQHTLPSLPTQSPAYPPSSASLQPPPPVSPYPPSAPSAPPGRPPPLRQSYGWLHRGQLERRSAHMSTTYSPEFNAAKCIDDVLDNFCHTIADRDVGSPDPWFSLEFAPASLVFYVEVHNRRPDQWGNFYDRLGVFQIWVGDQVGGHQAPAVMCAHGDLAKGTGYSSLGGNTPLEHQPEVIGMPCGAVGRFVTIFLPGPDRILNLAEVCAPQQPRPTTWPFLFTCVCDIFAGLCPDRADAGSATNATPVASPTALAAEPSSTTKSTPVCQVLSTRW